MAHIKIDYLLVNYLYVCLVVVVSRGVVRVVERRKLLERKCFWEGETEKKQVYFYGILL